MNRLKELRIEHDMTVEMLSVKTNIDVDTINALEDNQQAFELPQLEAFAGVFMCSIDYLIGIKETPKSRLIQRLNEMTELELENVSELIQ